jgi:hypothetical protein
MYSPMGVAPSCRTSKPRCCTIPSAVVETDLDDVAIVVLDTGAKLKALVNIELEFQTAQHNTEATAWNFII